MNLQAIEERASRGILATVRVAVATMWIANAHWKRPSDFGAAKGNGLAKYIKFGIDHPVAAPYTWFLREVVQPHLTAFGWLTVVLEVMLGALLLLGWHTRFVALFGAIFSGSIALTILRTPNEWPWAYYMMVALHLMLLAGAAGMHGGLDGLRTRATHWRALLPLGLLGIVPGVIGIFLARSHKFTAKVGTLVGWAPGELKLFWFNTLGAIVAVVIGVLALVGWRLRSRAIVFAGAGLAALAAAQVLLQWRDGANGETGGILGGNGGTLCLWVALAAGLGLTALADARSSGKSVVGSEN
jgi:uncharacterized membrane protein YphA (DoxX/SURF4 family)